MITKRFRPRLAALAAVLAVQSSFVPLRAEEPPQKIDVSQLNKRVDDVVVPVPSEIFNALNKLGGNLNWAGEVRKDPAGSPKGGEPQIALLLGTVIANGFIAVQAQNSEKVKEIGRRVLALSGSLGVRESVLSHCNSIIDAADRADWNAVRAELDKAQSSVRTAMMRLNSKDQSELISIAGWLRGTEALTSLVKGAYTPDRAELLHQPELLDTFDRQLLGMGPRVQANAVVVSLQKGLKELRPLITLSGGEAISARSVEQVNEVTTRLVKAISP